MGAMAVRIAERLRRTGLSGHPDIAKPKIAIPCGSPHRGHRHHRGANEIDMLGLEGQFAESRARRPLYAPDRLDQSRMERFPTIGEPTGLNTQLQGIEVGIALPDAHAGSLAGMPGRVLSERATLVGRIGHQPLLLAWNADVEFLAQAERARDLGDPVRAERKRGLVEEDVTGRRDRALHVLHAVMLVAVEGPSEIPDSVAGVGALGIDAGFQCRQRHHRLEGRPRRIGGGQRLVEQGLPFILRKGPIFRASQAANEPVGIEAWSRKHAEDVAVAAIHHHRRAAVGAEHLHGPVLDIGVEGEHDLLAGDRLDVAGRVGGDLVAVGVHLDLLRPRLAAEVQVESFLNALPADPKAGIQQDRVGVGAGQGQVCLVDFRHIADDVGERAAVGVDPHLAHVGGDAGQFRRADIDRAELLPAHVLHDLHGGFSRGV